MSGQYSATVPHHFIPFCLLAAGNKNPRRSGGGLGGDVQILLSSRCSTSSRLLYLTFNESINSDFYATVLCAAFGSLVGGNRVLLTLTVSFDQL